MQILRDVCFGICYSVETSLESPGGSQLIDSTYVSHPRFWLKRPEPLHRRSSVDRVFQQNQLVTSNNQRQ